MEISVKHKVPYDKGMETSCKYNDGDFWGSSVCVYHVYRDRTHGYRAPVERRLPKCKLFGVWLDGEYKKCDACLEACKEALDKPMQKPLTLENVLKIDDYGEAWWVEYKAGFVTPTILNNDYHQYGEQLLDGFSFKFSDYGETWRCWASRPTDEEREAAAWES